jgi:transketolase
MLATRDAFGAQLVESAKENENIIVLNADLAKATRLSKMQDAFPDRFFEMGIAECNMIGVASGMAEYGYRVFMASFASFLTGKYDVIRVSLGYSCAPVVLIGTHAGLAIGKDGVTQMGLEDISLMRSIPNMAVVQPATPMEAKLVTKYFAEKEDLDHPVYIRIGRQPVPDVLPDDYIFEFGKASVLREGGEVLMISSGCILPEVLKAADIISESGITSSIINMHTIKPLDRNAIMAHSKAAKKVVTIEDHSIIGGLGSAVAEVMAECGVSAPLTRIGLNDCFPESGPPDELWDKYGLTAEKIASRILGDK